MYFYLPAEIYWLGQGERVSLRTFLTFRNHVTSRPHLPDRAHVRLLRPSSLSSLDTCMSITKLPLQKTAWCGVVMLCQPMEGPPPQYFSDSSSAWPCLTCLTPHPHWCQWGGVQAISSPRHSWRTAIFSLHGAAMPVPLNAFATSESLLDRSLMSFLSSIVPVAFTALSLAHSNLNTGPLYIYN